ncbi:MAG: hypothetical protein NVSMB27_35080 [Ktedonobacteraceae bacterium]
MATHPPSQDEPSAPMTRVVEGLQGPVPPPTSAPQPIVLPSQPEPEETFFSFEDEPPEVSGTPLVAPFQLSNAMPTMGAQEQRPNHAPPTPIGSQPARKSGSKRRFSLTLLAIFVCIVLIASMLGMNALAQTTPPLQARTDATRHAGQQQAPLQQKSAIKPSPVPLPTATQRPEGQGQGFIDWVPQQLPNGWRDAGLTTGDGIQALRTAVAFNDREMSLDYRSVGNRTKHAGTFTAATFILTPAARQRFMHNDVRMANNILFDTVASTRLVRVVIDPQPQLVNFAQQGQQQFARVDVAFQLWQSQLDPRQTQQRVEGKDVEVKTQQPHIHHMAVVLLRVLPENAGDNPAMGGTGWLVSLYSLDLPSGTTLDIIQPA